MWFLSGLLLAFSLSMDAFGIGISYGLRNIKVLFIPRVIISLISVLFTALSIGIGDIILLVLPMDIAKFIGAAMLAFLGAFIVYQAVHKNKKYTKCIKKDKKTWNVVLKSFGVTIKIIRDPSFCDFDHSSDIDIKESIYLGVALSIDSFGAGISSAVSGVNSLLVLLMVGGCQLLFISLGLFLGGRLSLIKNINSNVFMVISGVILIALAGVRLFL